VDASARKEEFSYAYIHAIAATAGYAVSLPSRDADADGVDRTIGARGVVGEMRSPKFDVQVKCTSDQRGDQASITFDLALKNYDELRATNISLPRILIVVFVPDDLGEWLHQSETELCMRHCAYWVSLKGASRTTNTTTIRIDVPRDNLLSVEALHNLMSRVAARQDI